MFGTLDIISRFSTANRIILELCELRYSVLARLWKRRLGLLAIQCHTWTRAVESDFGSLNFIYFGTGYMAGRQVQTIMLLQRQNNASKKAHHVCC